jgi:hypothetical protein
MMAISEEQSKRRRRKKKVVRMSGKGQMKKCAV